MIHDQSWSPRPIFGCSPGNRDRVFGNRNRTFLILLFGYFRSVLAFPIPYHVERLCICLETPIWQHTSTAHSSRHGSITDHSSTEAHTTPQPQQANDNDKQRRTR